MRDPIAFWPKTKNKHCLSFSWSALALALKSTFWPSASTVSTCNPCRTHSPIRLSWDLFVNHFICTTGFPVMPPHRHTLTHLRAEHLCHHSRCRRRRHHRHCHQHRYRATTVSAARKALRRRTNPTWKLVSVQRTCTRFNAPHSTTLDRSNSSRLGMGD